MSMMEGNMLLSPIYICFVVFLCIVALCNVDGQMHEELSAQDANSKIAQLQFFLVIFCDDRKSEECDDLYHEVNGLFKKGETAFASLEGAVVTDKELFKKYGVEHFPALVFFRNSDPIFNMDVELETSSIYLWMENHRGTMTMKLTDANFEHDTQATSGSTTGDWLIMFYENNCAHLIGQWETVAGWLHQNKVVAKIELSSNPVTKKRFGFEKCVNVALLSNGKMYIYNGDLTKFDRIASFGRTQYTSVEALEIPPEPAAGFRLLDLLTMNSLLVKIMLIGGGVLVVLIIIVVTLANRRKRRAKFD